jgi:hypothetical protein
MRKDLGLTLPQFIKNRTAKGERQEIDRIRRNRNGDDENNAAIPKKNELEK